MPNFDCLEKVLGIASPPHLVYDFSKKKRFSFDILLTDQIFVLKLFVSRVVTL